MADSTAVMRLGARAEAAQDAVAAIFNAPATATVLSVISLIGAGVAVIKSPLAGGIIVATGLLVFGGIPLYVYLVQDRYSGAFEILHMNATWDIHASDGTDALMVKTATYRFRQNEVIAIPTTLFGDASKRTDAKAEPGKVVERLSDGYKLHYLISLPQAQNRGDELDVKFSVRLIDAFTGLNEFVGLTVSRPMKRLTMHVIMPEGRPCVSCWLKVNQSTRRKTLVASREEHDGRTRLRFDQRHPRLNDRYEINWAWPAPPPPTSKA